ncbi:hypothetical protein OIE75_32270 [Streptomyces sp. NBC_01723]|uniref:hypothetical protein n=1 Tax=Streptomyces sp. NBC_01723 TaxID=2975921 RepID=UPI002E31675C|nr:hypothetical protein [Streptomyces sp. NBC_01723]
MADPAIHTTPDEPRSPWLRSGFVLAAAFIGFVTVVAGAVIFTSDPSGRGDALTTSQPSVGRHSGPSSSAPSSGERCPKLPDNRQDVPTAAPRGVTWTLFGAVALPASEESGPAVTGQDVARCYARTPVGALLATSQISVRHVAAHDWRKVTRVQTVGAGRDAYIAGRTKAEKESPTNSDGGAHGQIAGFKFVTYDDSTAVIQTVWRYPDGGMQAATTTVLWRDGDWLLEYPAAPAAPIPVGSLAGYAEWGGV